MSLIFEILAEEDEKEKQALKKILLKLYSYIEPKLMFCQECGICADAKEIIEFMEYVNTNYLSQEIKLNESKNNK
jgi:hypothetical protein